jgi:outer membrane protein X
MLSLASSAAVADTIPAEHYVPIRVDVGLIGTYLPTGLGGGGFGGVVEPKFLLTDNIALGVQFQGALSFGGSISNAGTSVGIGAVAATLAKGEYLFTHHGNVRPFVGLGLGFYDIASESVSAGSSMASVDQKAARTFGVEPEIGVDLGAVRLAVAYNAMLGTEIEVHQTVGNAMTTTTYSENYLMFELGFRIGGGFRPDGWRQGAGGSAPGSY